MSSFCPVTPEKHGTKTMDEKSAKKILIVEDDEGLVAALSTLFKAQGYAVRVAYDGTIGTTYAINEHPDLIVLDLGLPAGGGFFVLENLKTTKDAQTIPVLILTAHTEKASEEKALRMGAAAFIRKPFDPQLLVDKVKEIVNR